MRLALVFWLLAGPQGGADEKIDFVRDVQPVFKASCLKCHGAEKPKGQFRLDSRLHAMKGGVSGKAIAPGQGKESLLVKLLVEADEELRMPQKAPPLPAAQVALLTRWIDEGAVWPDAAAGDAKVETHWAYVRPVRRNPPGDGNPIDAFVRARLKKEGIEPSPEADRPTLLKRLSYDLLGLPADPDDPFLRDGDWEKLVERSLALPHFGERWGRHWLDKARYADSDGYEKDNHRPDAWRWRDWVIDAVNRDLPFDRFTLEQLAGDLLPDAGPLQVLATAFHRQTLTNTEGGTDKEQFRVEACFDRAETTGTVWLGLTVGCARCHNHKYDAISQQEYYQLFAFFNNGDEASQDIPVSEEAVAKYEKDRAVHARKLRALEERLEAAKPALAGSIAAWEAGVQSRLKDDLVEAFRFHPVEILRVEPAAEVTFKRLDDGSVLAGGAEPATDTYLVAARAPVGDLTGFRLDVLADPSLPKGGPGRAANGNFVLSEFRVSVDGVEAPLREASADFSQQGWEAKGAVDGDAKTGWGVQPQVGKSHNLTVRTGAKVSGELRFSLEQAHGDRHTIGRFKLLAMTGTRPGLEMPEEVRRVLATEPSKRTAEQNARLLDHYAVSAPETRGLVRELEDLKKAEPKAPLMSVRVLVQRTRDPRKTHVMHRGEFLQPKHEVQPGTLASLHPFRARGAAPDRLDLAQWLVHPDNPLTARVAVNHLWAVLFGQGLVRTANDFGIRGERPTHPELLDWLATEYPRRGWSLKSMIRLVAASATYRQASRHRPELADRDPQNHLLARQNRFRVEAEIVRDVTLAASGLLSRKLGGPSVHPPMPADIAALSYANSFKWKNSEGEDRYRRGLYTYFKRTSPYPALVAFDCPDGNTTCVQRRASNTPLQALTLLNNEAFAEAARALGRLALAAPGDDDAKLFAAFRRCVARAPSEAELARLRRLLGASRSWYAAHPEEAKQLAGGPEEAAWTATARVLLNLDEFITRE
jgi:hypothetical protein